MGSATFQINTTIVCVWLHNRNLHSSHTNINMSFSSTTLKTSLRGVTLESHSKHSLRSTRGLSSYQHSRQTRFTLKSSQTEQRHVWNKHHQNPNTEQRSQNSLLWGKQAFDVVLGHDLDCCHTINTPVNHSKSSSCGRIWDTVYGSRAGA